MSGAPEGQQEQIGGKVSNFVSIGGGVVSIISVVSVIFTGITKCSLDKQNVRIDSAVKMSQKALDADKFRLDSLVRSSQLSLEQSKDRIERYKWVNSLYPELTQSDITKRKFTLALVSLALTRQESEQLFSTLINSSSAELSMAGNEGLWSIENEEMFRLVSQMNAGEPEKRKHAVAMLEKKYSSSELAVKTTIELVQKSQQVGLSGSGLINCLYFLNAADNDAWNPENINSAGKILTDLSAKQVGPQTSRMIKELRTKLQGIGGVN